ncbi:lytic transglycosylase domain-containing protein [Sulfitobacter sp. M57]|uniref:lytic transglycosylase domain-containing protein n=2 Tax=unclassified Sulfitobacter TaxID=196795 RepID=UPI0023E30BE2|nr:MULTISPECIES: lytic transglycosylase domain-containing protein [unclassified Sulfitobacter]MDF3431528.1 lytic transglycosylase domain-containing protein [Sulfitobacter sp. KE42]MDF3461072.1 lytic transglycosylase domain-containing protein [Sulfitobacter sp. Ks18]MDF3507729.1 lytic transglycosylase domain-containing protein [Sulfitobacter sp. M57]MDF3511626.1 lytic transglycosylase domain-containing protein [Sulfitobacter sp. M36]MDF3531126.1 lytic transglycosylase domain-containing protein 
MLRILALSLLAGVLCAGMADAGDPKPFADFSSKRVKPPKPGTSKRIRIQIDPAAQVPTPSDDVALAPSGTVNRDTVGQYSWFWDKISPNVASTGPGRLQAAIAVLSGATSKVPAPRLQQMQDIARSNGIDILRTTIGTNVSPALVLAVITVESAGKPDAESSAGAQGLMQLMPATAERFGVEDSLKPAQNITGGVKYLNWLMQEFDHDPILVLAGYNAGEGSVRKHQGVPPFAETRDYVPKVLAAFQVAKGLCQTPPELITDGCVFAALD